MSILFQRSALLVAMISIVGACVERPTPRDFTEEVEGLCRDYCAIYLECNEAPIFESKEECYGNCIEGELFYEDTTCGAAYRAAYDCVSHLETCADYLDSQNVHAQTYTCQAEKMAFVQCRSSDEGS